MPLKTYKYDHQNNRNEKKILKSIKILDDDLNKQWGKIAGLTEYRTQNKTVQKIKELEDSIDYLRSQIS